MLLIYYFGKIFHRQKDRKPINVPNEYRKTIHGSQTYLYFINSIFKAEPLIQLKQQVKS